MKVYTRNYLSLYNNEAHADEDSSDYYTRLYEDELAAELQGSTSDDVGGVVLYYKEGEEIAYFDYENLVGGVYALGGTRADYMP